MIPPEKQLEAIKRGISEIIPSPDSLLEKIENAQKERRPLRIKAGFDPTTSDIHLGHTVLLRALRRFQDLEHTVYFLIGDFTARIGDPSGQSEIRKPLTQKEVLNNARTYQRQVSKLLDLRKLRVVFNSRWCDRMSFRDVLNLTSKYTVARMLERDDFLNRYKQNKPISILEFLYPLIQGYDSVRLKADIELGGTDQKFNLLIARELQKEFGQEPQIVITMPILTGTDGVKKMSKTLGNYIGISEPAREIFGKIMSVSDELMHEYYELLTEIPLKEIERKHPMEAKKELARIIASQYCGDKQAEKALLDFERTFQKRDPFSELELKELFLTDTTSTGLCSFLTSPAGEDLLSKSDYRRLIQQGAIEVNGERVSDPDFTLEPNIEYRIKVGKRRFFKVIFRLPKNPKKHLTGANGAAIV